MVPPTAGCSAIGWANHLIPSYIWFCRLIRKSNAYVRASLTTSLAGKDSPIPSGHLSPSLSHGCLPRARIGARELALVECQLPLSPMRVFPIRIELANDVPVQCPHDPDARHPQPSDHRYPARFLLSTRASTCPAHQRKCPAPLVERGVVIKPPSLR
jgi:hypothetical protein